MFSLFKKKPTVLSDGDDPSPSGEKPYAIAFIDYEHWYISFDRMYHRKPDIRAWRSSVAEKFNLGDIIFFGDFSNPSLRADIPRIREISSYIIETQNASSHFEKDFTDFIMLDHIYQKAVTDESVDAFIIFSGDGHFSSVASFITNRVGKQVIVYGVKGALSSQLRNSASLAVEVAPPDAAAPIRVVHTGEKPAAAEHAQEEKKKPSAERQPKNTVKSRGASEKQPESKAPAKQRSEQKPETPAKQKSEQKPETPAKQKSEQKQEAPAKQKSEPKQEAPAKQKSEPKQETPAKQKSEPKQEAPTKQKNEQKPETPAKQKNEQKPETPAKQKSEQKPETPAKQKNGEKPDGTTAVPADPQEAPEKPGENAASSSGRRRRRRSGGANAPDASAQTAEKSSPESVPAAEAPAEKPQESNAEDAPRAVLPVSEACALILKNLDYLEAQNAQREQEGKKKSWPTFWGTVEVVSRLHHADRKSVADAMQYMLGRGYITQETVPMDGKDVRTLKVDWERSYGLYQRENGADPTL